MSTKKLNLMLELYSSLSKLNSLIGRAFDEQDEKRFRQDLNVKPDLFLYGLENFVANNIKGLLREEFGFDTTSFPEKNITKIDNFNVSMEKEPIFPFDPIRMPQIWERLSEILTDEAKFKELESVDWATLDWKGVHESDLMGYLLRDTARTTTIYQDGLNVEDAEEMRKMKESLENMKANEKSN